MPFTFTRLRIPEVVLIQPKAFEDARGIFMETFKASEFVAAGLPGQFLQDNASVSKKGVLRGLHFQNPPAAQAKLVSVTAGEIFDVAVDIRKNSPTFGHWVGEILSSENLRMLFVPEGFAHGFCVLSGEARVSYKVTAEYSAPHDRSILWNDPHIGVDWPIREPILSGKDAGAPTLEKSDNCFLYLGE
jgi:dTDP-4-dehydrorhamnose 3,5-epimerase